MKCFDLERFVKAQADVFDDVLDELRAGQKENHWMWFVFPQLKGLGSSPMAIHYGLDGLQEARAYLQHPVLGPRLMECMGVLLSHQGRSAVAIFGSVDAMKLRSCLTLFAQAMPLNRTIDSVLHSYFDGNQDVTTLALLTGD